MICLAGQGCPHCSSILCLTGAICPSANNAKAKGTGVLLIAGAIFNAVRLARWAGTRTLSDPLLVILHIAFVFVPVGLLLPGCPPSPRRPSQWRREFTPWRWARSPV
nr:NnrS family protein [Mesorhizobium sp.]